MSLDLTHTTISGTWRGRQVRLLCASAEGLSVQIKQESWKIGSLIQLSVGPEAHLAPVKVVALHTGRLTLQWQAREEEIIASLRTIANLLHTDTVLAVVWRSIDTLEAYIRRQSHGQIDPDDVLQEVMVRIAQGWQRRFHGWSVTATDPQTGIPLQIALDGDQLMAWAHKIAHFSTLSTHRATTRRQNERPLEENILPQEGAWTFPLEAEQESRAWTMARQQLLSWITRVQDAVYAQAFELRALLDLPICEVEARMRLMWPQRNFNEVMIRTRISRTRKLISSPRYRIPRHIALCCRGGPREHQAVLDWLLAHPLTTFPIHGHLQAEVYRLFVYEEKSCSEILAQLPSSPWLSRHRCEKVLLALLEHVPCHLLPQRM